MKQSDILFYALAAGSIILVVVLVMQNRKPKPATPPPPSQPTTTPAGTPGTTPGTTPSPAPAAILDKNLVLEKDGAGAKGRGMEVKELQKKLNKISSAGLLEDGIFGDATQTALVQETQGNYFKISLAQFETIFPQTATASTSSSGSSYTVGDTSAGLALQTVAGAPAPITTSVFYYLNPFNWFD